MGITLAQAIVVEIILTFMFVFAVLGVTSRREYSSTAGLVIGLSLTVVHLLGLPFTGTSVNPARSFGPALLVGGEAFSQVWVFIVAPVIGAIVAGFVFKFIDIKPVPQRRRRPAPQNASPKAEDTAKKEDAEAEEEVQAKG
jgi:glycerol uptake facilitator-like aquaporin